MSLLFASLLLSSVLPYTSVDGREIIEGFSHSLYCPFGASTVSFEHPTMGQLLENIDNGRLRIPEVTYKHNGAYSCRNYAGNEKIVPESIEVVGNPGRYEIDMTTPRMALNGNFRLECVIQGNITYAYFLVDGRKELFTNFSKINRNRWRFIYERPHDRVSRHDDGTEVQCVVKNRFGEPCCERSAKKKVIVEPPHATARPARETADDVNEGSDEGPKSLLWVIVPIAYVIVPILFLVLAIVALVFWIKKVTRTNLVRQEQAEDRNSLVRNPAFQDPNTSSTLEQYE